MDPVVFRNLRNLFSDIINGYSIAEIKNFGQVYIKHFNTFDTAQVDHFYNFYYEKAIKLKVPTQKDQEDYLLKEGIWTQKEEFDLINYREHLKTLNNNYSKEYLKSRRAIWLKEIDGTENKIRELDIKKLSLMGQTAEGYANKKSNEEYIKKSFYKNSNFDLPCFSNEIFEELREDELTEITLKYNEIVTKLNTPTLKKIGLCSFFLNLFYLCNDNPQVFYGKPVVYLTNYQSDLFGYGRYFKQILGEYSDKMPRDIMDDPDKIMDWVEMNRNADSVLGRNREETVGSAIMGATKEDLRELGMEPNQKFSLSAEIKKRGGKSLDMETMMKLHGE